MDNQIGKSQLLIVSGPNSGKKVPLNETPFSIGRDIESNYIEEGPGISRKHCKLTNENGSWWIEDLKSSNGVIVNSKKISHKTKLYYHDRIAVGETVFVFENPNDKTRNPALINPEKHIEVVGKGDDGMGTVFISALLIVVVGLLLLSALKGSKKEEEIKDTPAVVQIKEAEPAKKRAVAVDEGSKLPEMIFFNSVPTGATIYLNDEMVGETPLPLTSGFEKVNNYRLELDGYVIKKGSLVFPVDKPTVNVELEQRPGTIVITSTPTGASVYHGRHIIGKTPLLLKDWKEGEYELKINDFGYSPVMKKISVVETEPTKLHVKLQKYTRKIVVISNPPDAEVYVDGVFMGKTLPSGDRYDIRSAPLVLEGIKPGAHIVTVEKSGCDKFRREIRKMPEDRPYNIYADIRKN